MPVWRNITESTSKKMAVVLRSDNVKPLSSVKIGKLQSEKKRNTGKKQRKSGMKDHIARLLRKFS